MPHKSKLAAFSVSLAALCLPTDSYMTHYGKPASLYNLIN